MVSGSEERHAGYPLHVHIFQSFPRVLKNSSFFHSHTYPSIELDSKIWEIRYPFYIKELFPCFKSNTWQLELWNKQNIKTNHHEHTTPRFKKLVLYYTAHTNINFRWNRELWVKLQITEAVEENIRLWSGKDLPRNKKKSRGHKGSEWQIWLHKNF